VSFPCISSHEHILKQICAGTILWLRDQIGRKVWRLTGGSFT
jgi:hypothetical protein